MRLKLLAPFAVEGFRLRAARILEAPGEYERAWDAVAAAARVDPPTFSGPPGDGSGVGDVEALRFTHASAYGLRGRSRYRTIHSHALPRPLHAVELIVRFPAHHLAGWLAQSRRAAVDLAGADSGGAAGEKLVPGGVDPVVAGVEAVLADGLSALEQPPAALIRVHDHGVGLLEMDLPVPARLVRATAGGDAVRELGLRLDALQQLGIGLAEAVVECVVGDVLPPLADWLHRRGDFSSRFLRGGDPDARSGPASGHATLWVTRSLVAEAGDELRARVAPGVDRRTAIAGHWLKDVNDTQGAAARCGTDPGATCTSWLNYFFGEASYPGDYPADGWAHRSGGKGAAPSSTPSRDRAEPFCPTWDALLIAQYYYAAFDRLQTGISSILAVSVAGENRRSVATVKADLDRAIRDAHMLKVDFEENGKYYARRVAAKVDEILEEWSFEQGLRHQVDRRIEDCGRRLDELHSRGIERSGVYSDLILIAIGVTGVFDVLLLLAMYGRTMSADPYLQVYDRTSPFNVAAWLGGSSTDVVLLAGAFLCLGLVLLYVFVRMARSKV